jgi:hypothetical protein
MTTNHPDVVIVLRAMVTLRGMQRALHKLARHPRTPEYARMMTAVVQMEAQLDAALETVRDLVVEPDRHAAND